MNITFSKHSSNDSRDIPINILEAHAHSINHKQEIIDSELCGCFACTELFKPESIKRWVSNDLFCLCPNCEMDAVIGDKSGFEITKEFLSVMNHYWFDDVIWSKPSDSDI